MFSCNNKSKFFLVITKVTRMAQKKVELQRIANDKTRITTYKKRKACLYKKAEEFSTLCGVKTCLIVYGPTKATDEVVSEPEIWPRDETKVRDIIRKYRDTVSNSCRKETHVETFVNDLGKEREIENNNKRVKNVKKNNNKYCCWEEKLDKCSQEELRGIFFAVEHKLNEAKMRQDRSMFRVHQQAMETPNLQILMDHYNYMPHYIPEQQPQLMCPNMGFSLIQPHDDQIQMDPNFAQNWTDLGGLTQALMMSKGNDGQLMQRPNPYYNLEPVVQRPTGFTFNPGYLGGFYPWRLQPHQVDEWEHPVNKPI